MDPDGVVPPLPATFFYCPIVDADFQLASSVRDRINISVVSAGPAAAKRRADRPGAGVHPLGSRLTSDIRMGSTPAYPGRPAALVGSNPQDSP
jgi:hypothetical protein